MNISSSQVESIVRKILGEMTPAKSQSGAGVPKTAKVAMLTAHKKIEVKEFPVPAVGDNDILVKVEGCGVCGTDVHEWKGDPFGLIPVTLVSIIWITGIISYLVACARLEKAKNNI